MQLSLTNFKYKCDDELIQLLLKTINCFFLAIDITHNYFFILALYLLMDHYSTFLSLCKFRFTSINIF